MSPGGQLCWARVLELALGATRGLCYLHGRTPSQIHRDVKAGNLLLAASGVVRAAPPLVHRTHSLVAAPLPVLDRLHLGGS